MTEINPSCALDPRRLAIALALCGVVLAGQALAGPGDLLAHARAAALQDSHAVALRAYSELLAVEPALRDSLAPEIAAQLTWAGRYDEAIAEYQWFLGLHRDRIDAWLGRALAESWGGRTRAALVSYRQVLSLDPANRGARLGEARMLSWLGRLEDSQRSYRAQLRADPQDAEAWLGLAQVCAWQGENRRAREICQAVLERRPIAPDWAGLVWPKEPGIENLPGQGLPAAGGEIPAGAWELLALACRWSGRDDLALAALGAADEAGQESPAARRLEQDLRAHWVPRVTTALDVSLDSDDFAARSLRFEGEVPIRHRARMRLGVVDGRFDRPGATPQYDRWLYLGAEHRFSEPWYYSGQVRVQIDRPEGADYVPLEASLNGIWTPTDRLRVDLGASRATIFTFEYLPERVIAVQSGIGCTWRMPHALSLAGAFDYIDYSDDNERVQGRAGLRWLTRPRRTRLELEAGSLFQDTRRWSGHGYWCPDENRAHFLRLGLELPLLRGIGLTGSLETGLGREAHGDWSAYTAYGLGAVGQLGRTRIEGRFGHSGPSERVREGYRLDAGSIAISVGL